MRTILLDEAIRLIQTSYEYRRSIDGPPPFFYVVGAGVSHPPIPLAHSIVDHCRMKAAAFASRGTEPPTNTMAAYSYWFQRAYPDAEQRQQYIRNQIEGKAISEASFRLAHLLLDGKLANLVVTTNFDDHLTRALTLFGKTPVVCDHPMTAHRILPGRSDVQIAHVHGTYWFYDCCNLTEEISDRASWTGTMLDLLNRLLHSQSPLVIGYSGWEGDVVMTALKNRLEERRLPVNLYWFCYNRRCLDNLPSWLTDPRLQSIVNFVVPPEASTISGGDGGASAGSILSDVASKLSALRTEGMRDGAEETTLSAKEIFDALIRMLKLDSPRLITNPLDFLAEQFRQSLPNCEDNDARKGNYSFESVLSRLEAAARDERRAEVEAALDQVRSALGSARYQDAYQKARGIDWEDLEPNLLSELQALTYKIAEGQELQPGERIACYDQVLALGERLTERNAASTASDALTADALLQNGMLIGNRGDSEEECRIYDRLLQRFQDTKDRALMPIVAQAMVNKGYVLNSLKRHQQALEVFDEIVDRFGSVTEPDLSRQIAWAMVNKCFVLDELNQPRDAIKVAEAMIKRFQNAPNPELLRDPIARALNNMGFSLLRLGKQAWRRGREKSARTYFSKAEQKVDAALKLRPDYALAHGNRGYLAFLAGETDTAREYLTLAIRHGGEDLRDIELNDAEIDPLPPDEAFQALVRSIPAATS